MKTARIKIESSNDLEDIMNDMYHDFLSDLMEKDWATLPIDEDNEFGVDEGWTFIWTEAAHKMIERYQERMGFLFEKHYNRGLHLSSTLFQEA